MCWSVQKAVDNDNICNYLLDWCAVDQTTRKFQTHTHHYHYQEHISTWLRNEITRNSHNRPTAKREVQHTFAMCEGWPTNRLRRRFLVQEEPPPIRNENAPVSGKSGKFWLKLENVCEDNRTIFLMRKSFSSHLKYMVCVSSLCTFYRTCYANKPSPAFDRS